MRRDTNLRHGDAFLVIMRMQGVRMQRDYEQSQTIDASPEEVFVWLADVGNLPAYLPPVVASSSEGPSAEGVPGQRIRTTLEYPGRRGEPSTPRATSPWTRASIGWSGARRPDATT